MEKSSSMEMTARANGDQESTSNEIIEIPSFTAANINSMDSDPKDYSTLTQKKNQIQSRKSEIAEVKEENKRLKQYLGRLMKDYDSLQEKFNDIKQQEARKSKGKVPTNSYQEQEDADMVSLSLGIRSSDEPNKVENKMKDGQSKNEGFVLGLECTFEPESMKNLVGSQSASQEQKKEVHTEIWPPSKLVLKTKRSEDDEIMQQSQLKKARVCVRTRCDTPVMNDGCQWRKYGQKIAKGNPCPRAYYRCTSSPNCPVRKQVQRCAEDMSILITTYEGTHNHTLPVSATAMAFTTSAAASILQSRTISSSTSLSAPISISTPYSSTSHNNIHEKNFNFSGNSSRPSPHFSFPNSSFSTLNSHPTITLDLTGPSNSFNFNRFPSSQRYSPTCLNFSSTSSHASGRFNNGMPSNNTNQHGLINPARQQSHVQENYICQPFVQEKIAAATKVITTNPSFQSALAVALTSYVNGGCRETESAGIEGSCLNLKLGHDALPMNNTSGYTFTKSASVACSSSYHNKSSSSPAENKDNSRK